MSAEVNTISMRCPCGQSFNLPAQQIDVDAIVRDGRGRLVYVGALIGAYNEVHKCSHVEESADAVHSEEVLLLREIVSLLRPRKKDA